LQAIYLSATRRIAVVSLFSALAIATDYAMLPLINVKLMDSIVFVSTLAFGLSVGVSVGALTWLVYGSVNPLGSAGGLLLLILMVSEMIYALFGYLAGRWLGSGEIGIPSTSLLWGSLGLAGAFIYDLNTIIIPALMAGAPFAVALASLIPAIPFMLAHEVSDFAFFGTIAPALYGAIFRVAKLRAGHVRPI